MPMPTLDDMGRFPPGVRWTDQLQALLPGWQVIAEGQPGRTTVHDDPVEGAHRNGLTVLPAMLESHRPIDVVLIMLGTNDLKERFTVNAMDISLSLARLVEVVRGSNAGPGGRAPGVLLVAPPPIIEVGDLGLMFAGGAAKSATLAQRIAEVARRLDVPFVDAGALIEVSPIDGIHYDEPAMAALAQGFAAALQQNFG
jgi:lysophospholipase L1-like esterase